MWTHRYRDTDTVANTTYRHGDTDVEMHEHGETDTGDIERGAHRHAAQKQGCRVSDLVNIPC